MGGCPESLPYDGTVACHPDAPSDCPGGFVCKPVVCPGDYFCYRRRAGDREYYAQGCVVDGVCDAVTCETRWTCPDCRDLCDPAMATSDPTEFVVSSYQSYSPDRDLGVDLDGDGLVDNKWSLVANLVNEYTLNDQEAEVAGEIASGQLVLATRVYGDYPGEVDDLSLVQLLLAQVHDATPQFDGLDEVRLAPEASVNVGMCGRDSEQVYGGPALSAPLRFPVPWPGAGGTVEVNLQSYYVQGDVSASGGHELLIGGGITPTQVYSELLPMLAGLINRIIAAAPDGEETLTLLGLFDGACIQLDDVQGCETILNGEGACDGSAVPPEITVTELACNALLHSALSPDFDSDGDGVEDLISFGARLVVVPATIVSSAR